MPPVKIIIDSALREDGTDANFTYQLPRPIEVNKAYRAMCDQVHVPHTFTTIHANNRAVYFEEKVGGVARQHRTELEPKQYDGESLATHVRDRLTFATTLALTWTVTFNAEQGKLEFSVTGGTAKLYGMEYLKRNPHDFIEFNGHPIGDHDDSGPIIGITGQFVLAIGTTPVLGKHISVIPYHTLYLHCDAGLGTGEDAIGPKGNGTVLRSIPVSTSYGQMLHDVSMNPHDHTIVPRGQIGTFRFRLADKHGRDCSLDQSFMFSLIFVPVDEFE